MAKKKNSNKTSSNAPKPTVRKRITKKATSRSSKKVPRKKSRTSPKVTRKPADLSDSEITKIIAALRQGESIISALKKPTNTGYTAARELISRIVLQEPASEVSIGDRVLFLLSCGLSVRHFSSYATLDVEHIKQIDGMIKTIENYVDDVAQKRPLNFLMLASPGAGKSHFIRCLADRLSKQKVSAITYNMTNLQTNDDLIPALDAARNLKVEDRVAILFLDEFDSTPNNFSLLLPLLWDGSINLGQRDLRLGKVVIVMAGSDPELPATMDHAKSMRQEVPIAAGQTPKLVDLFSRINGGVLSIPPFYDAGRGVDRRTDKVCVAVELLRNRFGPELRSVTVCLLQFIAHTEFRYGVRSIAHLIDSIKCKRGTTKLSREALKLPVDSPADLKNSSLAYHLLHEDQAYGVVKTWEQAAKNEQFLPVAKESFDQLMTVAHYPELFREPYIRQFLVGQRHFDAVICRKSFV